MQPELSSDGGVGRRHGGQRAGGLGGPAGKGEDGRKNVRGMKSVSQIGALFLL